ncbi:hypothetical protein ACFL6F_02550, partial [Planctomycetota bacterium]
MGLLILCGMTSCQAENEKAPAAAAEEKPVLIAQVKAGPEEKPASKPAAVKPIQKPKKPPKPPRPYRELTPAEKTELEAMAKKEGEAHMQGKKGKEKPGKVVIVAHVKKGPVIDGEMDDIYKQAAMLPMDRNDSGPADFGVTHKTTVYLITDPWYLYIAIECREPSLDPGKYMKEELHKMDFQKKFDRMSKLTDRDQAMWDDYTWEDAYCEMVIEPGGKRKTDDYFHIAVNTKGTL